MARGGGFHERVLLPLWFGTLNTPIRRRAPRGAPVGAIPFLNGGLFGKTALEKRHSGARLSDESLGRLLGDVLGAYPSRRAKSTSDSRRRRSIPRCWAARSSR